MTLAEHASASSSACASFTERAVDACSHEAKWVPAPLVRRPENPLAPAPLFSAVPSALMDFHSKIKIESVERVQSEIEIGNQRTLQRIIYLYIIEGIGNI